MHAWFLIIHFTHTVCVLLLLYFFVCLFVFVCVVQSPKEDLIASVLGGKVIPAHSFIPTQKLVKSFVCHIELKLDKLRTASCQQDLH